MTARLLLTCSVLAALSLLAGCGSTSCAKPGRYVRSADGPVLRVPEDLSEPRREGGFAIPDVPSETVARGDVPCNDYPPKLARADQPRPASTDPAAAASVPVPSPEPGPSAGVSSGEELATAASVAGQIRDTLAAWAQAWSNGDFDGYLSYYSSAFRPPADLSVEDWRQARQRRLREGSPTQVLFDTLNVDVVSESTAVARFLQVTEYSGLESRLEKRLSFVLEGDAWRIQEERVLLDSL